MERRTKRPRTVPQTLVIIFPSQWAPNEAKLEQSPLTRLSLDVNDLFDLSGKLKEIYIVNALENPCRTIIRRAVNTTDTGEAAVSVSSLVVADVTVTETKERGNFFQKLRQFAEVAQDTGSGYSLSREELQISVAASGGAQVTFLDFVRHTFRCKLLSTCLRRTNWEKSLRDFYKLWWGGRTGPRELAYSVWLMYGGRPSIFRSCILRHGKINDACKSVNDAKQSSPEMPDLHSDKKYSGHNLALLLWYFRGEYFTPNDIKLRVEQLSEQLPWLRREQFPDTEIDISTNLQILASYPDTDLHVTRIGEVDMYHWDPYDPETPDDKKNRDDSEIPDNSKSPDDFLLQTMQNVVEQEKDSHGEFRGLRPQTWERKVTELRMFPFPANFGAALDRLADTTEKQLQRHKQSTGVIYEIYRPCPYRPNGCTARFATKANMKRHMNTHDKDKKPIPKKKVKCDICFKDIRASELKQHKQIVHEGKTLFECKICGTSFNRNDGLRSHMSTHSDKKPHKCETCGKIFARRSYLKKHIKRVHKGLQPYKCHLCPRRFGYSSNRNKHIKRVHKGLSDTCSICGKGLSGNLKAHIRSVHKGLKPHKCEKCPKSFSTKTQRKIHMRTHNGERPFKCDKCSKTFRQKGHLTRHKCARTKKKR